MAVLSAAAGAPLVLSPTTAEAKASKAAVHYRDSPNGMQMCHICKFYIGGRGGMMGGGMMGGGMRGGAVERPDKAARLDAVKELETQIKTLKAAIDKAPAKDPNFAALEGDALTKAMDLYTPEMDAITAIQTTLTTLRGGGRGMTATSDDLSALRVLANDEKATKTVAKIDELIKTAQTRTNRRGNRGGAGGGGMMGGGAGGGGGMMGGGAGVGRGAGRGGAGGAGGA
jgi:hypothetical protein